jgi:hypothetical protein
MDHIPAAPGLQAATPGETAAIHSIDHLPPPLREIVYFVTPDGRPIVPATACAGPPRLRPPRAAARTYSST